jgi:hypothetical protein
LFVVVITLLGIFFGRNFRNASSAQKDFAMKFAGVAVGAAVLHVFTLLRSDIPHFQGPSFLLPILLLMLPFFFSRLVRQGAVQTVLIVVSAVIIYDSVLSSSPASRLQSLFSSVTSVVANTRNALAYGGLISRAAPAHLSFVDRYSPLHSLQHGLQNQDGFSEAEEFFDILSRMLSGRPVEIDSFFILNKLLDSPEKIYFFGGYRSVSGITAPVANLWLKSQESAWIKQVVSARTGCVLFDSVPSGRLYEAWMNAAASEKLSVAMVEGTRRYGVLSCKPDVL